MKHREFIDWIFDMFFSVKFTALILPLDVFAELVESSFVYKYDCY